MFTPAHFWSPPASSDPLRIEEIRRIQNLKIQTSRGHFTSLAIFVVDKRSMCKRFESHRITIRELFFLEKETSLLRYRSRYSISILYTTSTSS